MDLSIPEKFTIEMKTSIITKHTINNQYQSKESLYTKCLLTEYLFQAFSLHKYLNLFLQ